MNATERQRNLIEIGVILLVWAAAIAVIRPRGDFPLNDDWDFAIATWNFARTGHFHFTAFTAVSLRAQVLWGAAWTVLFGQSFDVLRASTLTLAAATIVVIHMTLRRAEIARFGRIVATLAFAFHPVFIWASCTYMTEVPFVFASAVAFYFFYRVHTVRGCLATIVSWFVRQTGVTNLLAPLVITVGYRRPGWRRAATAISITLLLFIVLLIFRRDWISGSPEEFANHFKMWRESSFRLPQQISVIYHYTVFNVQNGALFFLPLVAALIARRKGWLDRALISGFALLILFRAQSLIGMGHPMPYFANPYCCDILAGNTLVDFGLGQTTLTDVWSLGYPYPFHLTSAGRLLLTYGSVIAGGFLLWAFLATFRRESPLIVHLAGWTVIAGTVGLFGSGLYVDRYSLDSAWPICFLLAAVIPWERRLARSISVAVLVAMTIFSTMSVQEYFAWNRARWRAVHALRARGVPVQTIDGGSEVMSFYELPHATQQKRRQLIFAPPERIYLLAFRPIPGYQVIAHEPFEGWLGWHRGAVYTLRKGGHR